MALCPFQPIQSVLCFKVMWTCTHECMAVCKHAQLHTHTLTHFRGIPTCFFARDYNSSLDVIVDESQKKSHSFDNAPIGTSLMNAVSHMHVWHTSLSIADAIAWVFRYKMTYVCVSYLAHELFPTVQVGGSENVVSLNGLQQKVISNARNAVRGVRGLRGAGRS